MQVDIVSFYELDKSNTNALTRVKNALLNYGIIGIKDVPAFVEKSRAYIHAARAFSALDENIKQQYAPNRDVVGDTEGYELGAEQFKDEMGNWQVDDKKASYYAFVPDRACNRWPTEVNLKTPYLELGELIFQVGKKILDFLELNNSVGINHNDLAGYGRMLHYHKVNDTITLNPNWCGAHFDHDILTGLMPAYYYQDGKEIDEPQESGLFILPTNGNEFVKIEANDKSILFFQVGEFAQLASNDAIKATKHLVKKPKGENIERFTLALFYSTSDSAVIHPASVLTNDARYLDNKQPDGSISYGKWRVASFERYLAR